MQTNKTNKQPPKSQTAVPSFFPKKLSTKKAFTLHQGGWQMLPKLREHLRKPSVVFLLCFARLSLKVLCWIPWVVELQKCHKEMPGNAQPHQAVTEQHLRAAPAVSPLPSSCQGWIHHRRKGSCAESGTDPASPEGLSADKQSKCRTKSSLWICSWESFTYTSNGYSNNFQMQERSQQRAMYRNKFLYNI